MSEDRMQELSERIRKAKFEEREETKCNKFQDVKLTGENGHYIGYTKSGHKVNFDNIEFGMTNQGMYGAGTLKVETENGWETIFTKGYPSKALQYMSNN